MTAKLTGRGFLRAAEDEVYFGQLSSAEALAKAGKNSQRILDEFWAGSPA